MVAVYSCQKGCGPTLHTLMDFSLRNGQKDNERRGKTRNIERQMGLGSVETVSLSAARERARECRQLLQLGTDPIDAQRATKLRALAASIREPTFKVRKAIHRRQRTGMAERKTSRPMVVNAAAIRVPNAREASSLDRQHRARASGDQTDMDHKAGYGWSRAWPH